MKIGFTGTQRGMTQAQVDAICEMMCDAEGEFHHGDCIGADEDAHDIAKSYGMMIVLHPPTIRTKRAFCEATIEREAKPYLERNKDIVRETELLIATPGEKDEQLRSGTWSTVRFARKLGKRIWLFFPDGSAQIEPR